MKITIAVLVVLLIGVSGWFYYDHSTLIKKSDMQTVAITKLQSANAKQTSTLKTVLGCVNATETNYQKTKNYVSVLSCVKTKLNI